VCAAASVRAESGYKVFCVAGPWEEPEPEGADPCNVWFQDSQVRAGGLGFPLDLLFDNRLLDYLRLSAENAQDAHG
jgi:hypothetical protein